MPITTHKHWKASCDRCSLAIWKNEGDFSEWSGEPIWNRGQLDTHLRRTGWTLGKVVLCPSCAGGRA